MPIIGHMVYGTGILAAVLFLSVDRVILFWMAVCGVALLHITWRLLLFYARRGFSRKVSDLQRSLLYSRTLEKRLRGDDSTDLIEKDDVDVLIARLLGGMTEDIPSWAITEIDRIDDLQSLIQENPDQVDPDAQPTWLLLLNNLFLLACPILLATAIVLRFKA